MILKSYPRREQRRQSLDTLHGPFHPAVHQPGLDVGEPQQHLHPPLVHERPVDQRVEHHHPFNGVEG
jgi:hypothetical protein